MKIKRQPESFSGFLQNSHSTLYDFRTDAVAFEQSNLIFHNILILSVGPSDTGEGRHVQ